MLSGTKLQYIRRLKGYSQKYIAECIGVSERWISKVENENNPISQETYDKWLVALYSTFKPENNKRGSKKCKEKNLENGEE